jgi:hypothetical protein
MSPSFPGVISSYPWLSQLYAAREQTISFEAATISSLKPTVVELPSHFRDTRINEIVSEILTLA